MSEKRSTGPNARPKNETIAQSGEGLPDDSGGVPPEARDADENAARRSLDALGKPGKQEREPGASGPEESGAEGRSHETGRGER